MNYSQQMMAFMLAKLWLEILAWAYSLCCCLKPVEVFFVFYLFLFVYMYVIKNIIMKRKLLNFLLIITTVVILISIIEESLGDSKMGECSCY